MKILRQKIVLKVTAKPKVRRGGMVYKLAVFESLIADKLVLRSTISDDLKIIIKALKSSTEVDLVVFN